MSRRWVLNKVPRVLFHGADTLGAEFVGDWGVGLGWTEARLKLGWVGAAQLKLGASGVFCLFFSTSVPTRSCAAGSLSYLLASSNTFIHFFISFTFLTLSLSQTSSTSFSSPTASLTVPPSRPASPASRSSSPTSSTGTGRSPWESSRAWRAGSRRLAGERPSPENIHIYIHLFAHPPCYPSTLPPIHPPVVMCICCVFVVYLSAT